MNPIRWILVRLMALGLIARHLRHDVVVVGRIGTGRLYVMRDRPDWYVNFYAAWPTEVHPPKHPVDRMVAAAREEQSLRMQRELRDLEIMLRGVGAPEPIVESIAELREQVRTGQ